MTDLYSENEDRYIQQFRRPNPSERRNQTWIHPDEDRPRSEALERNRRHASHDRGHIADSERRAHPNFGESSQDLHSDRSARFQEEDLAYRMGRGKEFQGDTASSHDWNKSGDIRRGRTYPAQDDVYNPAVYDFSQPSHRLASAHFENRPEKEDSHNGEQQKSQRSHTSQRHFWPKGYKRSDERLKDDIHEAMIRHGRLDASDLEVQVKDGDVTLVGTVPSKQQKRLAEDLAEDVLGVNDVVNLLRVKKHEVEHIGSVPAQEQIQTSLSGLESSLRPASSTQTESPSSTKSPSATSK